MNGTPQGDGSPVIRLGDREFRLTDGQLFDSGGRAVPLRAKSAQMLSVLLASPGRILGKDELAEKVWPGLIATDESISQCISDIRKAIGDRRRDIVETFPKRGYRINLSRARPEFAQRRWRLAAVLALLPVALALVAYLSWRGAPGEVALPAPVGEALTVAVLPFTSPGDRPVEDYLRFGLAEDLIVQLSGLPSVRVVSGSRSFALADAAAAQAALAGRLGARHLVHGSIRQDDSHYYITVQLVDGQDATVLWAGRYDFERDALQSYQPEVLTGLVGAMSIALSEADRGRLQRPETDSPLAFDALQRGRRAVSAFTYAGNLEAERHFRRAIEADPDYARPHAELAAAFAIRLENGWAVLTSADEEKAFYFAERALQLDPGLWLAHYALGRLNSVVSGHDLDAAARHLAQAMSIQPLNDDARVYYAAVRGFAGHLDETLAIVEGVLATHPEPPFWYYLSLADPLVKTGQYARAEEALDDCLTQMPNAPYCLRFQIVNYALMGRIDDAQWAVEEYEMLGHEASVAAIMRTLLDRHEGQRALVERALRLAGLE